MKQLFIALFVSVLTCSCYKQKADTAQHIFAQAQKEYEANHTSQAKVLLDSVIFSFSEEKDIVAEAKQLMNKIYRTEQEQNLAYLDSLLAVRQEETKKLMKNFFIEDEHNDTPVLIHKRQSAAAAYERSYVRGYTDVKGTFYMSSHYTGSKHIGHCAVRVAVGESYAQTDSVTHEALNHSFGDEGQVWEVVKYKNGADNGAAAFVARNHQERIVVTFVTPHGSSYRITMTQTDKDALRDTYQLSLLLRETEQIKSQLADVRKALAEMNESVFIKK